MINNNNGTDIKKFLVRLGATVVAIILVMFLAKVWFIDQTRTDLFQKTVTGKQADTAFSKEKQLKTSQVISWQDAVKHYGEFATVEGKIVATYNSGKACFLNFHKDYKRHFTAVILASVFSRFPEKPEKYYYGEKVHVHGYIKEYNGKPEIILNDPSQIEILK